jgi:hypothetical protein
MPHRPGHNVQLQTRPPLSRCSKAEASSSREDGAAQPRAGKKEEGERGIGGLPPTSPFMADQEPLWPDPTTEDRTEGRTAACGRRGGGWVAAAPPVAPNRNRSSDPTPGAAPSGSSRSDLEGDGSGRRSSCRDGVSVVLRTCTKFSARPSSLWH